MNKKHRNRKKCRIERNSRGVPNLHGGMHTKGILGAPLEHMNKKHRNRKKCRIEVDYEL
jgi:hypothetical protein